MWEQFTVEETNLMCMFDTSSRGRLIAGIITASEEFDDDMAEIAGSVIDRLGKMSESEFRAFKPCPDYEDETETEVQA